MKKKLLTTFFAFSITVVGFGQLSNNESPDSKVQSANKIAEEKLTFGTQEEKDQAINRIERLIELRTSQGKTEADLKNHYKELDRAKNAIVLIKKN